MKKQKVEGGAAVATASANITASSTENLLAKTSGRSRKRKRSKSKNKFQNPCHEMPQFKSGNFQGLLWMYFNKKDGAEKPFPVFKTFNDPELKLPGVTSFVTTCKVDGLIAKGRGNTKKKSQQLSCLAIIQKLGLVPSEKSVNTMAFNITAPAAAHKKKSIKPAKPIIEYKSYLQGNFKGTLEAHLRKNDPQNRIIVKSEESPKETVFVTRCSTVRGNLVGTGRDKIKKKSIQLACLDYMLNVKLLTTKQHFEKHPAVAATDKIVKENQDASKSSKPQEAAAEEDLVVEKQEVGEPEKGKPEADRKEEVAMVKQNAGDPPKML